MEYRNVFKNIIFTQPMLRYIIYLLISLYVVWNLVQDRYGYLAMLHISCLSNPCTKELSSCTAYSHGDNSISLPWTDNLNNHVFLFNESLNIQLFYYLSQWPLLELYEIENGLRMRRNMSLLYTHKIYCLNIAVFSLIHILYIII